MGPPIGNACVADTTDSPVGEAASLMPKHHIGAVAIVEPSEGGAPPFGILAAARERRFELNTRG